MQLGRRAGQLPTDSCSSTNKPKAKRKSASACGRQGPVVDRGRICALRPAVAGGERPGAGGRAAASGSERRAAAAERPASVRDDGGVRRMGATLTSRQLAATLAEWRQAGREVALLNCASWPQHATASRHCGAPPAKRHRSMTGRTYASAAAWRMGDGARGFHSKKQGESHHEVLHRGGGIAPCTLAVRSRLASVLAEVPRRRGRTRTAARRVAHLRPVAEHAGLAGQSRHQASSSFPHEQPRPAAAPELLGRGHPLRNHRGRLRRLLRQGRLLGRALRLHRATGLPAQPGRRLHRAELRRGRLRAGAVVLRLQELRRQGPPRLRAVRGARLRTTCSITV